MSKIVLALLILLTAYTSIAQSYNAGIDSTYPIQLKGVQVNAKFTNDTERYHFNQMRYYVTTILPYLEAATKLFNEINAKLQDPIISKKERREFINKKEEEMRDEFEDKVTSLNVTQGVLLVKLIARQTDMNIYKMLSSFKNPLVAIKWQAWARLHGMNLDEKYHPEDEPKLELIMEGLGYPLPACYAVNNN
jgi:hypothetical protein